MKELIELLHSSSCSCVIRSKGEMRTYFGGGISDLLALYRSDEHFLQGAEVADKVVGKAAASLMVCGGVSRVYADLMSENAQSLFRAVGIPCSYSTFVPYIKRRDLQGMCPMESLTLDAVDAEEAVRRILAFLDRKNKGV